MSKKTNLQKYYEWMAYDDRTLPDPEAARELASMFDNADTRERALQAEVDYLKKLSTDTVELREENESLKEELADQRETKAILFGVEYLGG